MFTRAHLEYFTATTEVGAPRPLERGFEAPLGDEKLRVEALRPDIVRFAISRGGRFERGPAVMEHVHDGIPSVVRLVSDDATIVLETARLTVRISRAPFSVAIHRDDGSRVLRTATTEDDTPLAYATLNDAFLVARRLEAEDAILGLGQKAGALDRNGRRFLMWNTDILAQTSDRVTDLRHFDLPNPPRHPTDMDFDPYYISIPFYHHLDRRTGLAAGFFFDNAHPAYIDFSDPAASSIHFAGGGYVEYVIAGPGLAEVVEAYTWLTGRMAPPPLWALGHHQCRWHLYTQDQLLKLAATYRHRGIPCDALWLDIDYMDGFRVFTWHGERFPDGEGMAAGLQADGFRLVTIIDPGVKIEPGYPVYDAALAGGHLCRTEGGAVYTGQVWPGRTAFPDYTQAKTRAWWAERIAGWARQGVAGAWIDMNEPATGDIDAMGMRFAGGADPHRRHHNRYATLMAEATAAGLATARPERRPFVLSRAGSPGIQRFAANWLGDNCSRWEHLAMSLPMALGLSLSGQPFVGADVGGFAESADGELLARWYQAQALGPFLRNHNCDRVEQYPWAFGEPWESACREAIRLRYRLMPYLYATFMQAWETGAPVQRPLAYAFQDDPVTWAIEDQFMLGDHLLVAPVLERDARSRTVYLPAGHWHDWHTGAVAVGPAVQAVEAPIKRLPLFVRAGAVVPAWPEAPLSTMGHQPGSLDLLVFVPPADDEIASHLYEDDGETWAMRDGAFVHTAFRLHRAGRNLTLTGQATGAGYPEFRRTRFDVAFLGGSLVDATVDGKSVPAGGNTVRVEAGACSFELAVTLAS
ncbi:MAG: DUF5110 domain-containing protein [Rhodospirillales bacterium]|nr:MAG: DUF5110 domain-containing protein [Rhodospirillales bacterium]